MEKIILKYALQNAVKYGGKADPGRILGKVIGEHPDWKGRVNEIRVETQKIVAKVNIMSHKEQQKMLEETAPELLEEKPKPKKELHELNNPEKVVMRFEPSPSGPLHIGHAYVFGLNAEYCRQYNGKLILRIADTNSSNIYPPAYDMIPQDAKWLTDNVSEVIVQSERMELYYNYALKLIELGRAYICTCSSDQFKEYALKKIDCPCRKNSAEQNVKKWRMMFTDYDEGDAVMRIKTSMKHKNPAMRDFPLMRINNEEHPRKGKEYRVWPLMNWSVSIDDYESGVTHTLRGKDHADNAKRQKYIFDCFGWKAPETLFVGRINFIGLEVSCSKTRKLIESGVYSGWDDIRLPFIPALKRRGYMPGAFIKYALSVGVTLNDKTVMAEDFFKTLNAFNKKFLEPIADRHFFVAEPKRITVKNSPNFEVELDLHPDTKKGGRVFNVDGNFFIHDALEEGKIYRLMDCLTFKYEKGECTFLSRDYEGYKDNSKIIHWLPAHDVTPVDVLMPDNTLVSGYGERLLEDLQEGAIIHFPRFGFCRLDKKEPNKLVFWYAHN